MNGKVIPLRRTGREGIPVRFLTVMKCMSKKIQVMSGHLKSGVPAVIILHENTERENGHETEGRASFQQ